MDCCVQAGNNAALVDTYYFLEELCCRLGGCAKVCLGRLLSLYGHFRGTITTPAFWLPDGQRTSRLESHVFVPNISCLRFHTTAPEWNSLRRSGDYRGNQNKQMPLWSQKGILNTFHQRACDQKILWRFSGALKRWRDFGQDYDSLERLIPQLPEGCC